MKFKKFALIFLLMLSAVCLAAGASACGGKELKISHDEGEWDENQSVFLGMASGEDCPSGNIQTDKVSKNILMQKGKEYYLIVDFTLQPTEDNDGLGKVDANVNLRPASAVSAILEETASAIFTEDVKDDVKTVSVEFSIPEKAKTAIDRRIVLRLIPLIGSEYEVTVNFDSDRELVGNLSEADIRKTLTSEYTEGLTYALNEDGGYCVSGAEAIKDLTEICIPCYKDGKYITEIGEKAFFNYTKLTSVNIPEGTVKIGEDAFYNSPVKQITLPDGLEKLGAFAFGGCALTNVTIPASVNEIGYGAFSYCVSLESINVDGGNVNYYGKQNCIIEIKSKTLVAGCKNSVIPDDGSAENISDYAFCGCLSLNSIKIPDTVKDVGSYAFAFCYSLEQINIPDSVVSLGEGAFRNSLLRKITLGNNLKVIEKETFFECLYLIKITISENVTSIGSNAFAYCNNLASIYYNGTAEEWSLIDIEDETEAFYGATIYYYSETKPAGSGNYWHYVDGKPVTW